MKNLEIIINGKTVQVTEQIKPIIEKVVSEFRNPSKRTGSYSYTIKFPITQTNKVIFNFQSESQVIGKFRETYSCIVLIDSVQVLTGNFILNKISKAGFEGFISGQQGDKLGDIIPNMSLKEIKSFTPISFSGDTTVWNYLDQNLNATNSEICFPYVSDSFSRLLDYNDTAPEQTFELNYESFGVSHFTAAILKNIFTDAGYSVTGNVLSGETFNKLALLYSNESGADMPYNFGTLAPVNTRGSIQNYMARFETETSDYYLFTIVPSFPYIDGYVMNRVGTGDFARCLEMGVYTAKFTGIYEIKYNCQFNVHPASSSIGIDYKAYTVFREYSEQTMDANWNTIPYADFLTNKVLDSSAYYYPNTTFKAKLENGKQYVTQIYVAVPKSAISGVNDVVFVNEDQDDGKPCVFEISSCSGDKLLNPAKFLPEMKQIDFVQALFKIFNLYYQVNTFSKTITLYTRDEFYELNKNNILDLSKNLDLSLAVETALDSADITDSYYRYATDDSDYVLKNTDYMNLVNGDIAEDVYELPFSPLSFIKMDIIDKNNTTQGVEFLPAAIPNSDITDQSLLSDTDTYSFFSYKPKIALYQTANNMNSGLYPLNRNYATTFSRTAGLTSPLHYSSGGTTYYYKYFPKLTFFNALEQPIYQIVKDDVTREFHLERYTGSTIYSTSNSTFINSGDTTGVIGKLNKTSIALEGTKSEFQQLYKNDLLITNFSNYFECDVKMNPVLYSKLTGRNILKVENDLYLLESIKQYDLTGDTAKIKLYKLVSS